MDYITIDENNDNNENMIDYIAGLIATKGIENTIDFLALN